MTSEIQLLVGWIGEGEIYKSLAFKGHDPLRLNLADLIKCSPLKRVSEPELAGLVGVVLERFKQDHPNNSIYVVDLTESPEDNSIF